MGCPCREIRAAVSRFVPGGKYLVGLLPALPSKGSVMKMLAPAAGQSFNLSTGGQYFSDPHRVIHDVQIQDVAEMRRVGCVEIGGSTIAPEPVAVELVDPLAQAIMHAQTEADPAEHEVEHEETEHSEHAE
jgi:hypothetical protein